MFETLMTFVGSATGGVIFGTIGNAIKTWQETKDRENQRKHDLELRKLDREEMELESRLNIRETTNEYQAKANFAKTEGAIATDIADREVHKAALKNDKATYSAGVTKNLNGFFSGLVALMLVFVDMIRGLIRPTITVYLIILESVIAWHLYQLLEQMNALPVEYAGPVFVQVISSIVFLTATAVTFWFGSRPSSINK